MEVNKKILLHAIITFIGVLLIASYFIYDNEIFKLLGQIIVFLNIFIIELIEYKEKMKKGEKKSKLSMIISIILIIIVVIEFLIIILPKIF